MGQNFNTVSTEVTRWKSFSLESDVYDLSHLNSHHAEYLDDQNANNPITYKFIVTAYPTDEGLGKIKKVSFLVIANNLLTNKKLPKP
jgi:hypothetical protein